MTIPEVDVLVVGAGPVGLSTALFLAHHGVRVAVVDKRSATFPHHRAGTSLRTLELFRSLGLGEQVSQLGWQTWGPLKAVVKDSAFGAELARINLPERYARRLATCSPIGLQLVPQDELEAVILTDLRRLGVSVCFDIEVADIAVTSDEVRVRMARAGAGTNARRVRYLVACDGARSRIRERIGAGMPDREIVGYPNTAFYRADLGDVVHQWQSHFCFVRNNAVYATVASFNGRDLWSSHIMDYPGKPDGPAELSRENTLRLLRAALGDDRVRIDLLAVNSWEAALGISSTFGHGRVFLAGDAAHVQTSAGGLGMNTGIQDGHNLAWKLAAVLHGQASPGLLDSYEPERRAAAEASVALSRLLSLGFRDREADPDGWYNRIGVDYLRAMLLYRYDSPAVLGVNLATPALREDEVLDDAARTGYRLPHRWIDTNHITSTLDLVGTNWLLLTSGHTNAWREDAEEARRQSGIQLQTSTMPGGLQPSGVLLARPDGFIAWQTPDTTPNQRLPAVLQAILHPEHRRTHR